MKYKVIGWTSSDDYSFEDTEATFAVQAAITDSIKEHGYLFTGYYHQEYSYGAPVLNTGKRVCMSQRGFARLMADAHGDTGVWDYARYMMLESDDSVYPSHKDFDKSFFECKYVEKEDITEEFSLAGLKYEIDGDKLIMPDYPELNYIEEGDTVLLGGNKYEVSEVDRYQDISSDKKAELMARMYSHDDPEKKKNAEAEFLALPILLSLKVKRVL